MSRKMSMLVFDDFIVGTADTFSSPEFNELLARHERVSFQVIVDQVTGTSPTLLLQQQHCSDNRNFVDKGSAEIPATSISGSATIILNGYEHGTKGCRFKSLSTR